MESVACNGCGKQVYYKLTKCPYCRTILSSVDSLDGASQSEVDRINRMDLSKTWKQRFVLIARAGGPDAPQLMRLSPKERRAIGFNLLAFLFGPIYYLMKGLWRQASVYFALTVFGIFVMDAVGLEHIDRMVPGMAGIFYAWRANISCYKKAILGEKMWI